MADKVNFNGQDETRTAKFFLILVLVLGGMLLISWLMPQPEQRKYPNRKLVRFWHMWTAEWQEVVEKICDRFNESQQEYEVVPLSVPPGDADSKFLIAVAGQNPPDCMAQWNPVIPKWADSDLILPLDSLMRPGQWQDLQKAMYSAALKIGSYKGRLYGVTTGLNIFALYYRPDYFREAGLDPDHLPPTLEGLAAWGTKLHKYDPDGSLRRIGFLPSWYRFYAPVFGNGFYDWNTGQMTIDTPSNLRALQFLVDERVKIGFDKVVRFESSLNQTYGGDWPFISGAYAVTLDGQWRVEQLKRFAPHLPYKTAPVPPPAGGRSKAGWTSGNFLVIPKSAHNAEGAWEFIKFWSGLENPERAAEFYTWGGWLPLSDAIAKAPVYRKYVAEHPQFQTFLDILPSANVVPSPPVPYQVYLMDRIDRADDSACRGTFSPKQALERLQEEIEQEQAHRRENGYPD